MRSVLGALTTNWQLKLLAFVLAVLLWVVVSGEQVQMHLLPVPLDVRVSDPRYELVRGSAPQEVDVRFVGPGREFVDVAVRRPRLVLDIPVVDSTEQVVSLNPAMVQVPSQLALAPRSVAPERLRLRFRRLGSVTLPVQVRYGPGYGSQWTVVDSLAVEPATIEVRGPEAALARFRAVPTVPLEPGPEVGPLDRSLAVDTALLGGLRTSTRRVRVSGRVEPIAERIIAGIPVRVGGGVRVEPTQVEVVIRGARSVVDSIRPGDLRVMVAIDSLPARLPVQGLMVPLRVEEQPGLRATPVPSIARLSSPTASLATPPPPP